MEAARNLTRDTHVGIELYETSPVQAFLTRFFPNSVSLSHSGHTQLEPGMLGYMLVQQVKGSKDLNAKTAPEVYYMFEHYKDREAFQSHMKSPHFQKFGPKLMDSMAPGPLKMMAPAIPGMDMLNVIHHAAVPGTFCIVAEMNLKPGKRAEFEQVMKTMMEETHKEPGMLAYTLCQEVKGSKDLTTKTNPDRYFMVECYKSRDTFSAHLKSAHFTKWGPKLGEFVDNGPMQFLAPVFAPGSKL